MKNAAIKGENVLSFPNVQTRRDDLPAPAPAQKQVLSALERYPEDAAFIGALSGYGVKRIYGMFDWSAWTEATTAAELYLLPVVGRVRANVGGIIERARRLSRDEDMVIDDAIGIMVRLCVEAGTFLPILFPQWREYGGGSDYVTARFPQPPRDVQATIQRAHLAGLKMYVAVPGDAVRIDNVAWSESAAYKDMLRAERLRADPITFGVKDGRVAVLGFYNQSQDDPEALQVLLGVLKSMETDIG